MSTLIPWLQMAWSGLVWLGSGQPSQGSMKIWQPEMLPNFCVVSFLCCQTSGCQLSVLSSFGLSNYCFQLSGDSSPRSLDLPWEIFTYVVQNFRNKFTRWFLIIMMHLQFEDLFSTRRWVKEYSWCYEERPSIASHLKSIQASTLRGLAFWSVINPFMRII